MVRDARSQPVQFGGCWRSREYMLVILGPGLQLPSCPAGLNMHPDGQLLVYIDMIFERYGGFISQYNPKLLTVKGLAPTTPNAQRRVANDMTY